MTTTTTTESLFAQETQKAAGSVLWKVAVAAEMTAKTTPSRPTLSPRSVVTQATCLQQHQRHIVPIEGFRDIAATVGRSVPDKYHLPSQQTRAVWTFALWKKNAPTILMSPRSLISEEETHFTVSSATSFPKGCTQKVTLSYL